MKQWQSWVIMLKGQCYYPGSALFSLWGKEWNRKIEKFIGCTLSTRNFLCAWTFFKVTKGLGLQFSLCSAAVLNLLLNELTGVTETFQLQWHGAVFRLAAPLPTVYRSITSTEIFSFSYISKTVGKVIVFSRVLLQQCWAFIMLLSN